MDNLIKATCNCQKTVQVTAAEKPVSKARKTIKALPSFFTSLLIAFFPKCPVCWAIYMSMFGSIGLARIPYMGWMLPVLMLFLAIHLFMLYKKSATKGYLPFLVSLTGAVIIVLGRSFFPLQTWLLVSGMCLIISGSLLNSFLSMPLSTFNFNKTII